MCHIWAAGYARAEDVEQVKRGAALTRIWCIECHVTGARSQRSAADIAPTFHEIANDKRVSGTKLRAVLIRPHRRMPTDALTVQQIEDVITYILSLKEQSR
jgi:mono/diheme cytochrome c family protein